MYSTNKSLFVQTCPLKQDTHSPFLVLWGAHTHTHTLCQEAIMQVCGTGLSPGATGNKQDKVERQTENQTVRQTIREQILFCHTHTNSKRPVL